MHQSGHSRAQSMHEVQFSSVSAMTPRDRGGSAGATSGYSAVCVCRVRLLAVVASPLTSPGSMPSLTSAHLSPLALRPETGGHTWPFDVRQAATRGLSTSEGRPHVAFRRLGHEVITT